jgi:type I restriction enzyme S subunit
MRSERIWGIWVLISEIKHLQIKDIADVIMGQSPSSDTCNHTGDGLPFYQGVTDFGELYPNPRMFCREPKKIAEIDDILFSVRAPIARINIASHRCATGRGVAIIRAKNESDHLYLRYAIQSIWWYWESLEGSGAIFSNAKKEDILNAEISWGDETHRHFVTSQISSLENLLLIKKSSQSTVNEFIKLIFRSWFIDFDPVKAKAEGKLPYGMDDETAALFADSFKDSEYGILPNDWRWGTILDLSKIWTGGTPKTSESSYWGGDIPWVSGADLSSNDLFAFDSARKITSLGVEKSSTKILPVGTVMITARGTVGATKITAVPMAMSQTSFGFKAKKGISDALVYLASQETILQLRSFAYGAVFDTFTQSTIDITKIAIAPIEVLQAFGKIVDPLFETMKNSAKEIIELSSTRDALLPRLMSGELKVN